MPFLFRNDGVVSGEIPDALFESGEGRKRVLRGLRLLWRVDKEGFLKVLEATDRIVGRDNLTTIMITHNMKDAIAHGNRLIMMHEGRVIYDVSGEEKKNLKVSDLLAKFEEVSGGEFANDRMMLS